jgi:hypothetical protein
MVGKVRFEARIQELVENILHLAHCCCLGTKARDRRNGGVWPHDSKIGSIERVMIAISEHRRSSRLVSRDASRFCRKQLNDDMAVQ